MSNFLAIATVTGTLRTMLAAAASAVPGATVTTKRPDGSAANQGAGINIYLYQVTPNAAYRNEDLPTRRSGGELTQRPRAALVLHYLLSFFGEDKDLVPQRLLGATIRQLHAQPQLGKKQIQDTLLTAPFNTQLNGSNLADQLDRVRFTPLGLSLDELSKVWSVFFQSPYLLSVAYQASAVLIETDDAPSSALPVKTRTLEVTPFRQPFIEKIVSATDEAAPILLTSPVAIRGTRLKSEQALVSIDGAELGATAVSDTQITVGVPAGTRAGPHALQVIEKLMLGVPKTPHRGFESNVGTFVLHPTIVSKAFDPPASKQLLIKVDVDVGDDQRVQVMLDSTNAATPASFSLPAKKDAGGIKTDTSKVPAGTYFIRLQIDGAASPLDLETTSATFGPTVTLS